MLKLKSKITIEILDYFFLNPDKKHNINQLADLLKIDPGNLFRKLEELETEGILVSTREGNQRQFSLNQKYPFLKELEKLYYSKHGFLSLLKEKIAELKNIQDAYIFGSFAKGKLGAESDIDLLLIGSHSPLEAKRTILPLQDRIKREINIVDLSPKELEKKKKNKDEFINNIFSNKLIKVF